jgi:hypothetical protein
VRGSIEVEPSSEPIGGAAVVDRRGEQLSADPEFSCPSARNVVSVYKEYELSVVMG